MSTYLQTFSNNQRKRYCLTFTTEKEQYTHLHLHKQYSFRSSAFLLFSSTFDEIFSFDQVRASCNFLNVIKSFINRFCFVWVDLFSKTAEKQSLHFKRNRKCQNVIMAQKSVRVFVRGFLLCPWVYFPSKQTPAKGFVTLN